MDLCKSKQLFLSRIERSSAVPPPPSSSPSKSPNQSRRRQKATSESVAHDLLIQRTALAVPGYAADNSKRYRGAHRAEGEESTEEEEEDYDSFQLIGYPELASKDRFKSASLEWTTGPNGVVTPRASHYNTHPPLDFKSLKEKLKILIGSPHETNRKPFAAFSSSSSASGHDERKTGLSGLQSVPYVTSPSADMMCSEMLPDGNRPTSTELLRNISNKKEERLKNAAKESHFLERSNRVLWKDLAHHVAESDKTLQMILNRHHKELEDLKKKHEKQWIQLKSQISKSKDVQNLGRELMLNSEVRCSSQTLTRSKSDIQLTAYEAATKLPNRYRPTSKSELSETGRRDGMMSKHRNEYAVCPAAANFTDSYRDIIIHARPGGSAPPKENCPHAQRDANYPLPVINSHLMGSFYPTVSGVTQLTRSVDARCVSPISQRQSELEMAKQLENQMHALISLRLMHHQQQLTNLDLAAAAKAQRPSVGTGFYALPNGCFQYFCMPMLQQLQSPTVFAAAAPPTPIYPETVCPPPPPPPPPPPTNTFPGAGTSFPWNRTEFPQRMGSRTPCREFVQHHAPGNVLPDPSRQFLYNSLEQLALPSEIARINSSSFAPSPIVVKAQPPAPPIAPCFDNNNYLNSGYSFPCFVNPFQSVPMSFLHPSMMQYPAPDFKDLHQPFIPQPTDHQPYLTWS